MQKIEIGKEVSYGYAYREALNSLKANLSFCGAEKKVFTITSCIRSEGKSTIAFNLAFSLAMDGKKVIFVDADLRKSAIVGRYSIKSQDGDNLFGLAHFLSGQKKLMEVVTLSNYSNFFLIPTGGYSPNPIQMLSSELFAEMVDVLKENFDVIIVDTPPLGEVIDTVVVAPHTDGVIFVMEDGRVSVRFAQDVKKQLDVSGCEVLGVVLNKVTGDEVLGKYSKYGKYKRYGKYGRYGNYGRYGYYGHYGRDGYEGRYGNYSVYGKYGKYGQYGAYGDSEKKEKRKGKVKNEK